VCAGIVSWCGWMAAGLRGHFDVHGLGAAWRRKHGAAVEATVYARDGACAGGGNSRVILWRSRHRDDTPRLGRSGDIVKDHGLAGARAPVEARTHSHAFFGESGENWHFQRAACLFCGLRLFKTCIKRTTTNARSMQRQNARATQRTFLNQSPMRPRRSSSSSSSCSPPPVGCVLPATASH
jgi:hypothetical protein